MPEIENPCGKLVYESPIEVNDEPGPGGTHKRIRFQIVRYELCVFIRIFPPDGGNKAVIEIKLNRDPGGVTIHPPGGKTTHVQSYSKPSSGQTVGKLNGGDAEFYGKFIIFVVDGCDQPKFVQFIKQTETIGKNTTTGSWVVDGGKTAKDPFPGTLQKGSPDDGSASMTDWPGRFEPPSINLPSGTQVTLTQDFETYVCCGGNLIGYWSWTNHISYVAKNGAATNVQVDPSAPEWQRDPNQGVNHDKVTCK